MQNSTHIATHATAQNDHVYLFTPPAATPLDSKFPGKGWIHIAPFGNWKGHPAGPVRFDRDKLSKIVSEFDKLSNPLQVDYHHQSLDKAIVGPIPAAGWLHALEIRNSGLWGYVMFTQKATDLIRTGEMLYCSPVILSSSTDRKTGDEIETEMFNLALTNDPFLDGQTPIQLGRLQAMVDNTKVIANANATETQTVDATAAISLLAEQTGMEPTAVLAAIIDRLEDIGKLLVGTKETEGMPQENKKIEEKKEETGTVTDKTGVTPNKWEADRAGQIEAAHVIEMNRALTEENTKLKAEKDAANKTKVEARVKELIETGYAYDSSREDMVFMFSNDWERAERIFAAHKVVPIDESQANGAAGDPKNKDKGAKDEILTEVEQNTVGMLVQMNMKREVAVAKILARRATS